MAGACFAFGYGITQRIIVMQGALREPRRQDFSGQAFPGESLESLRRRKGDDRLSLTADVEAREAELARKRDAERASQEAQRQAAEAKRKAEQQAVLPATPPADAALPEPAWAEPVQAVPAPVLPKPDPRPEPVVAQPLPAEPSPVLRAPFPAAPVAPPNP